MKLGDLLRHVPDHQVITLVERGNVMILNECLKNASTEKYKHKTVGLIRSVDNTMMINVYDHRGGKLK